MEDRDPERPSIDLVTREEEPFNAGTPIEALAEPVTPNRIFYVRNHFDVPELDPEAWRLEVGGEVESPVTLSLTDLRRLPPRSVTVTMECAGNGRRMMDPLPGGTPWSLDAVSTARFSGTSLRKVLDGARVKPEAVEIVFEGADRGEVSEGRVEPYARSLPTAVARDPDVLLAWEMNGEPLPPHHGHPVRLVVPSWYGMASVKWLVRVRASRGRFRGWFQAERYVYVGREDRADGAPLTHKRVRALIARPPDGETLPAGAVEIAGVAWSGGVGVRRVEVSTDGGETWGAARLGGTPGEHASVPWTYSWESATSGKHTLMARATDEAGETQPLEPRWNEYGYGNNVVQRVEVELE